MVNMDDVDDNTVARWKRAKGPGVFYAVCFDESIDRKFIEAAQLLQSTPEAIFATIISSFLESFETCLEQSLAAHRENETKH